MNRRRTLIAGWATFLVGAVTGSALAPDGTDTPPPCDHYVLAYGDYPVLLGDDTPPGVVCAIDRALIIEGGHDHG